jgi:hypothetical protein
MRNVFVKFGNTVKPVSGYSVEARVYILFIYMCIYLLTDAISSSDNIASIIVYSCND